MAPQSQASLTSTSSSPGKMALLAVLTLAIAALIAAIVWLWPTANKRTPAGRASRSVGLVVLGDIGRSPRMIYHAQSFVAAGFKTYIIAYAGQSHSDCLARCALTSLGWSPTLATLLRARANLLTLRRLDPACYTHRVTLGRVCVPPYASAVGCGASTCCVPVVRAVQGPRRRGKLASRATLPDSRPARLPLRPSEAIWKPPFPLTLICY